jgi:hypothetical protein
MEKEADAKAKEEKTEKKSQIQIALCCYKI